MPIAVPGQRRHPVAKGEFQAVQRVGHLAGTFGRVTVGVAVNITLYPARNDFSIAMVAFGEIDQARDEQWLALH